MRHFFSILKKIFQKSFLSTILFYFLLPWSKRLIPLDYNQARALLNNYSPKPMGNCLKMNQILEKPYYDLQIIIPAYNVEEYIKKCINSVLLQKTCFSFFVYIIDDGSTDNTPQIIDSFSNDPHVKIIHTENKGLSSARNLGLEKIDAKYIMFVDSDDELEPGAIQLLMEKALEKDADIVEGNYNYLKKNKKGKWLKSLKFANKRRFSGTPWAKVFRNSLFNNVSFPDSFWFEDSIISFLVYPTARQMIKISNRIYDYRIRSNSITQSSQGAKKSVDTYWITELLVYEHALRQIPHDYEYDKKIIRQILLNAKRVRPLDEEIQKSIFVLTSYLLNNYFHNNKLKGKNKILVNEIIKGNYGVYKLFVNIF